ncbi:MAG: nicotinate-nucleotide adenylyltransferase [Rhodocyclaceae bacterium]|nr:nicotinate-nucleotide adenylyltransferase [Rhodocyclaceae bacterium]
MKTGNRPLGILGGTFDPIHNAHLRLAEEATSQLRIGGVLWIPAGQPAHRSPPVAPAADRLAMVRRAVAGHPDWRIDDSEIASDEPSYTVPTLERLRQAHGEDHSLVLLLGADAFLGLASWHRWRDLFRLAHVAVVSRPGFDLAMAAMDGALADEFNRRQSQPASLGAAPAGAIVPFTMEAGTVSSTTVRALLAAGADAGELLPAPVLEYIASHHLYRPD